MQLPGFTAELSLPPLRSRHRSHCTEILSSYADLVFPAGTTDCYYRCMDKCTARQIDYDLCQNLCWSACTGNV
jgi:hypothetical protein